MPNSQFGGGDQGPGGQGAGGQGARVPGCQGARVPGCQGARVPGCQGARARACLPIRWCGNDALVVRRFAGDAPPAQRRTTRAAQFRAKSGFGRHALGVVPTDVVNAVDG
ncbi:hypothetical protein E3T54_03825 [Cryobacterium sp. Sr8]|nr:hypothetical protein E3T54_03825 [Cryobacterium sp. Sr8]